MTWPINCNHRYAGGVQYASLGRFQRCGTERRVVLCLNEFERVHLISRFFGWIWTFGALRLFRAILNGNKQNIIVSGYFGTIFDPKLAQHGSFAKKQSNGFHARVIWEMSGNGKHAQIFHPSIICSSGAGTSQLISRLSACHRGNFPRGVLKFKSHVPCS